jgi:hypothetical protein
LRFFLSLRSIFFVSDLKKPLTPLAHLNARPQS